MECVREGLRVRKAREVGGLVVRKELRIGLLWFV